jgi:hypothetical protein
LIEWFNTRLDGAIRGKWRIPVGKVRERFGVIFRVLKVVD